MRRSERRAPGRPLRVVVVSHEASRSGAPRVAVDVLTALRREGMDVTCVLRWPGPMQAEMAATAGRLALEPLRRLRVLLRKHGRERPAIFVETVAVLLVLLRYRPDVVHLNSLLSACYLGPCRRLGVPAVLHAHEVQPWVGHIADRYDLKSRVPDAGVAVIACSRASQAAVSSSLALSVQSVEVVPSVPDEDRIVALAAAADRSTGQVTVGLCARVNANKGSDLWAEAATLVAARGAEARFLWVGGARPPEAPAGDPTHYLPATDNPYPWLAGFDIFVLPSRTDAFPLVVLEAMLLGAAVVAFDIGGVRQQVGDAGLLVAPEDPQALADAVESLLVDAELRRRLAVAGQARARELYPIRAFHGAVVRVVRDAAEPTHPAVRTAT